MMVKSSIPVPAMFLTSCGKMTASRSGDDVTTELMILVGFCLALLWMLAKVLANADAKNLPKLKNDPFRTGIKDESTNQNKD